MQFPEVNYRELMRRHGEQGRAVLFY